LNVYHFLYYLDLNVWKLSSVMIGSWNSHKQPRCLWTATVKSGGIFRLRSHTPSVSFCLMHMSWKDFPLWPACFLPNAPRVLFLPCPLPLLPAPPGVSSCSFLLLQWFHFPCLTFRGHFLPFLLPATKTLISHITISPFFFIEERFQSISDLFGLP